jgi:hypothetical protein
LAAEMRTGGGWPDTLTLRGRRREDEYAGARWDRRKRTGWEVRSKGRPYWANCAWDTLGIPAALHADAKDGSPARLSVEDVRLRGEGGGFVHFPLPLRRWYEDLVFT